MAMADRDGDSRLAGIYGGGGGMNLGYGGGYGGSYGRGYGGGGYGGAPAQMRADYLTDPRLRLAMAMSMQGMETTPITTHAQGLARLAQALGGGLIESKLGDEYRRRAQDYHDTLQSAAGAESTPSIPAETKTYPGVGQGAEGGDSPTTINWKAQPGGHELAMAMLQRNADTAPMALQQSFQDASEARAERLATARAELAHRNAMGLKQFDLENRAPDNAVVPTIGPDGQPVYARRTDAAGRPVAYPPHAPQAEDRTLVQTIGPDGQPVWTPRGQAVGMSPPGKAKSLSTGQEAMNAQIEMNRTWLEGQKLDFAEIIRRSQKASSTGLPNADFDQHIADAVRVAARHKYGDDPDHADVWSKVYAPPVQPTPPAPPAAPSEPGWLARNFGAGANASGEEQGTPAAAPAAQAAPQQPAVVLPPGKVDTSRLTPGTVYQLRDGRRATYLGGEDFDIIQ